MKKEKANLDIRQIMKSSDVAMWEIGKALGVCEQTVIRWFRTEMPQERKELILQTIGEIKEGR